MRVNRLILPVPFILLTFQLCCPVLLIAQTPLSPKLGVGSTPSSGPSAMAPATPAPAPPGVGVVYGPTGADYVKPFYYVDKGALWPSRKIEVCWEADLNGRSTEQAWVRSAVSKFIEQNSRFSFGTDWPICDADQRPRIRIMVRDLPTSAPESEVGYQSYSSNSTKVYPTHMVMNFTFKYWLPDCASSEANRERCIETIAVHEFMHAIGALHEQLSPDIQTKDPRCWTRYKNTPDIFGKLPYALTDYDPDSIMNYCRPIYSEPTRLSALDLVGLSKLSQITGTSH